MAKERLWSLGNREPSDFVRALEEARRKVESHRQASEQAWQDCAALLKLLPEAVGRLLVLEDEREAFLARLTVSPLPVDVSPEEIEALCQDALGGSFAELVHDASRKGWPADAVYQALIAYGHYMRAFSRKSMGINQGGECLGAAERLAQAEADGYGVVPPYGTERSRQAPSNEM